MEEYIGSGLRFPGTHPRHFINPEAVWLRTARPADCPRWGLKNNQMWYAIVNELGRRGTWQGCRVAGVNQRVCNLGNLYHGMREPGICRR